MDNTKGILILVAIVVIGMFFYNFFIAEDVLSEETSLNTQTIGANLLKTLAELEKVTFDRTIFSDPKFLELSDSSVPIPDESLGRPNPFNVIGRD